jgi:hypothetical protein
MFRTGIEYYKVGRLEKESKGRNQKFTIPIYFIENFIKNTKCMFFYITHKYTSENFHEIGQINLISNPI